MGEEKQGLLDIFSKGVKLDPPSRDREGLSLRLHDFRLVMYQRSSRISGMESVSTDVSKVVTFEHAVINN